MKRIKKVIALTAMFMAATLAFAVPTSNTMTATAGLISDGLIDNLNTGKIGEGKGLAFTGFTSGSNYFKIGLGEWIVPNLWASIYYNGNISASRTEVDTVTDNAYSTDGITIDYTNTTTSDVISADTRTALDNLYLALYSKALGMGAELYWTGSNYNYTNIPYLAPGAAITTSGTTAGATDIDGENDIKEVMATDNIKYSAHTNTFGSNFNDVKFVADGDLKFFAQLDKVAVYTYQYRVAGDYSKTKTINGSVLGAGAQIKASGVYNGGSYLYPFASGRIGFNIPTGENITTKFSLLDTFGYYFYNEKNTSTYVSTSETASSRVTTTTNYDVAYGKRSAMYNYATPRLDFGINAGERVTVNARAQAEVYMNKQHNGSDIATVVATTVSKDKTTSEKTKYVKQTQSGYNAQNYDYMILRVTPKVDVGVSYAAKPQKVLLNFGVTARPSVYSWSVTEYTNSGDKYVNFEKTTDAAGLETTDSESTVIQGNGVAQTRTKTHSVTAQSSTFYFGVSFFPTEKVSIDAKLQTSTSFGLGSILNDTSSMDVQVKLKF